MPSYWRVSPRFWTDTVMRRANDDARMLALYLLTCPHRNVIGLFWLPRAYMCADLGWDPQRLAKPFGELLTARFMAYDEEAEVLLIRNALKYQSPENPNQVEAALRQLDDLPATFLASDFRRLAERFCERLWKALPEGFGKPMPEPPAPTTAPTQATDNTVGDGQAPALDTVVEQARPDDPTQAVFDAWRQATGKHRAKLDPKRLKRIKAALRSYSLADVLDAVRGWQHSPHHRGENEQGTVYNELDLLLRDAAHIEQFRDLWRSGPTPRIGRQTARTVDTYRQMRAMGGEGADLGPVDRDRGQAQRELSPPAD